MINFILSVYFAIVVFDNVGDISLTHLRQGDSVKTYRTVSGIIILRDGKKSWEYSRYSKYILADDNGLVLFLTILYFNIVVISKANHIQ